MKKIVVLQEEISDCGVCSLLSIIRYYGGNTNLESLRIDSLTTKEGVNAYNLIECAKKNGLDAKGIKTDLVEGIKLPAIIHFQINKSLTHFVVLYEINDKYYKIMDPSKGIIKMPKDKFKTLFTGNVILLEPKGVLPFKKNINIIKTRIINELKNHKSNIVIILVLDILFIIFSLINSYYIKIFDYKEYIITLSCIFIGINSLVLILSYFINKNIDNLYKIMSNNLTINFLDYIFRLPLRYLHLKDPGEIIKRTEEINLINDVVINSTISIIINGLILLVLVPFLEKTIPNIIFFFIIFIILFTTITVLSFKKLVDKSKKAIESETNYNNIIIDNMTGLTSIKHSMCENFILDKIKNKLEELNKEKFEYTFFLRKNETLRNSFLTTFRLIVNIYLISLILDNKFNFQNLIIVDILIEIILNSYNNILSNIISLNYVKNLFSKANDFYNLPINDEGKLPFIFKDIKINISILFNPHSRKQITTKIKKGEKVIIKGESGCGKSTLCKILYRELDSYKGKITIGNQDIKNINIHEYQKFISYSSQSEKIFTGTIKDNILLGRDIENQKFEDIINICKLERIINKKTFGLDTFLFSGGEELSGGERQLIILARSLVNNFQVLILDETLSEVNDEVENEILINLFDYYKNKTIIYVSHKNKKDYFRRTINV